MDYRATYPQELIAMRREHGRYSAHPSPSSPHNLATILRMVAHATVIVAAWGTLPAPLRLYADIVECSLFQTVLCMGTTKDRSPRHPLYLRNDAQPMVWRR
jgi:hypothetical protein